MQSHISEDSQPEEPLRLIPVAGRHLLHRFINMPKTLYVDDPCWVPPLVFERAQHLSGKNPYFEHAEFQAWLACRGARTVGRISAQIDQLHLQQHADATGFFGFLEAEDNAETFQSLLSTAEDWLRQRGMKNVRGPFSLSINDECGLLVEGFESPPPIMLGHALPYYGARVEEQGYIREQDLLAYRIQPKNFPTRYVETLTRRVGSHVNIRTMRRKHFQEDLEIIRDIFADAWSQNWGYIPFTPAEFVELGKNLKLLVDPEWVRIAEVDGDPAAMIVMFPNVNEMISDLNGRLLPLGWLKLLWRLKVSGPKSSRIPLMGVRQRYQGGRLGAALSLMMIAPLHVIARNRGIREVDMSWILEQNQGVRNIIESLGSEMYKRYRIYQKELYTG
jgi:GNAT superfamily N-acetyltransferase